MNIIVTGIISGFRSIKEIGCWSFGVHTQEIPDSTAMALKNLHGNYVKILITDNEINHDQIEAVKNFPVDVDEKWSPSQKQRFAIIEWAVREGITDQKEQEKFYRDKIETNINHVNRQCI